MYTEQVPIIYQSINYTEDVRECVQKRYLYIPISQLHRGGDTVYTEEVPVYIYQSINYTKEVIQCLQKRYLYIPMNELHRGSEASYTEAVPIYTNRSITQKR